jgi:hypothetical protein
MDDILAVLRFFLVLLLLGVFVWSLYFAIFGVFDEK